LEFRFILISDLSLPWREVLKIGSRFVAFLCLAFYHQNWKCQPALARRDVSIQLFSLIMNASLCSTASCHARSGPGVWARDRRSLIFVNPKSEIQNAQSKINSLRIPHSEIRNPKSTIE